MLPMCLSQDQFVTQIKTALYKNIHSWSNVEVSYNFNILQSTNMLRFLPFSTLGQYGFKIQASPYFVFYYKTCAVLNLCFDILPIFCLLTLHIFTEQELLVLALLHAL